MKLIKQDKDIYTIRLEKVQEIDQKYSREFVVNKIAELQNKIDLMVADKGKYEEVLTIIDNDKDTK
jgi:hypothetical protein